MSKILIFFVVISLILTGCSKNPVGPVPPQEDFSYPPSTRFAVSLYSEKTNYNLNSEIDIRLIFYNLTGVFGTAVEISYDQTKLEITNEDKIIIGPYFKSLDSALVIKKVDQPIGRVSGAISYWKNSDLTANESGVVFKIKAKAVATGNIQLSINKDKLQILRNDGRPIDNFQNLQIDSLNITIQ